MIRSCTIVTTEPNLFMQHIHNRMPAMLSEEAEALWLDRGTMDITSDGGSRCWA